MTVIRSTWLVTVLFAVASTAIWWSLVDSTFAIGQLVPTVLITPVAWWIVVGDRPRPHIARGLVGGALAGFVTQGTQQVLEIGSIHLHRHSASADGEGGAAAIAAIAVYLAIAVVATVAGSLLGLIAVVLRRLASGKSRERMATRGSDHTRRLD